MAAAPQSIEQTAMARLLETKVAQGYRIESQTDTEAVLVTSGRKRFLRSSADSVRQILTVGPDGAVTTRKVD